MSTKIESKHTPTAVGITGGYYMRPIHAKECHEPKPELALYDAEGSWIGEVRRTVAPVIVRAVNSHEALLEACKAVARSGPLNNGLRDDNTLAVVRKAIAQAEGK